MVWKPPHEWLQRGNLNWVRQLVALLRPVKLLLVLPLPELA